MALSVQSLIPYRDDVESRPDLKKKSEAYRRYSDEVQDLKDVSYKLFCADCESVTIVWIKL